MKRLSLCLIAKNEEENLQNCLESVRGHVDEIIVVDTGSTDRTREVAVRYGASVFQFDHINHPEAFLHDTAEECRRFNAPGPYSGEWHLSDFGAARNESFKHATGDYLVWMDADDVMETPQALRAVVDELERANLPMAFLPYNYQVDHLGRVFYRQWRERVVKRGSVYWANPVHEVLMPVSPMPAAPRFDAPLYIHRRKADRGGMPHRNYKILLRQAWQLKTAKPQEHLDPRILFYLGQEAKYVEPHKAVNFYEEYLSRSHWPEERAAAHLAIGQMLEFGALGLPEELSLAQADREYACAHAEMPDNPEGMFGLARIASLRKRWIDVVRYTEAGFKIGNTDTMLGTHPMDRVYRPHVAYNFALAQLGRIEDALASCRAALNVMPDDPGVPGGASGMLTLNVKFYEGELARRAAGKETKSPMDKPVALFGLNEDLDAPPHPSVNHQAVLIWGIQIWKQIVAAGDGARARAFLETMPEAVSAHPVMRKMIEATARRFPGTPPASPPLRPYETEWSPKTSNLEIEDIRRDLKAIFASSTATRLRIAFYLGAGPEHWDPRTPNQRGLGGSETAAIHMARELCALGHHVVVFAEAEGMFDGVQYIHHSKFTGIRCDVFIASRAPWAVEQFGPVLAGVKLLWVHDIHCGPPEPRMERWLYAFDRILCLSKWHKDFFLQTYPTVHPDQVVVTRNGIDTRRFEDKVDFDRGVAGAHYPRLFKQNRLVFSSSPNRGVEALLHNFRAIKAAVPDAELDIYYGFDTWETIARSRGAAAELEEIARYKRLIEEAVRQGGVHWHGKRPQSEVAAAYMRAKVWGYLTGFPETSCITAMEAQAAGCVPVCTAVAALPETVKHGVLLDPTRPDVGKVFVETVIDLLRDERKRSGIADLGRDYALKNLGWDGVAKQWDELMKGILLQLGKQPIPMWSDR